MDPGPLLDVTSKDMICGTAASIVVYALHIVLPLAMTAFVAVRAMRARRRGALADARWESGAPLEPGPAVLHGSVELAPGRAVAMRVEIDQQGSQTKGKNGWSHAWTEYARRTIAEPFYVEDRRGARVRVEATPEARLVDALDQVHRSEETRRTKVAEVTAGEDVFVTGELVRGRDPDAGSYRGAETTLVMRAPEGGRLLVSAEPLGERFRAMARSERTFGLIFVILGLVFNLFDLGFHLRTFAGTREIAEVVAFEETTGKNAHCRVTGRLADGSTFDEDLTRGWCSDLAKLRAGGQGARVPVVHAGSSWLFVQIGAEPGVHVVSVILGVIFLGIALLLYRVRDKPWYEAKVVDVGGGRLPPMA